MIEGVLQKPKHASKAHNFNTSTQKKSQVLKFDRGNLIMSECRKTGICLDSSGK